MKIFRDWFNFFIFLFILAAVLYFFSWPFIIVGNSMQNTFQNHDRVVASRLLSKFKLKRGDIIICKVDRKNVVKRIIALPGEHIVIKNFVYVNKKKLHEPYVNNHCVSNVDIILKNDEYFIMGDNRSLSRDSRFFGPAKKSNLIAKVLFKFFPSFSFVNYSWEDL